MTCLRVEGRGIPIDRVLDSGSEVTLCQIKTTEYSGTDVLVKSVESVVKIVVKSPINGSYDVGPVEPGASSSADLVT